MWDKKKFPVSFYDTAECRVSSVLTRKHSLKRRTNERGRFVLSGVMQNWFNRFIPSTYVSEFFCCFFHTRHAFFRSFCLHPFECRCETDMSPKQGSTACMWSRREFSLRWDFSGDKQKLIKSVLSLKNEEICSMSLWDVIARSFIEDEASPFTLINNSSYFYILRFDQLCKRRFLNKWRFQLSKAAQSMRTQSMVKAMKLNKTS